MQNGHSVLLFVLWLNFVLQVLPARLAATFTELLIGIVLSKGSVHVTDALLAVGHRKQFTTYYWFLARGKWQWTELSKQLLRLVMRFFPRGEYNFIIDDFVNFRSSKKVPFGAYHHEHGQKPNRPRFIWGQQIVALGLSISYGKLWAALPLVLRIHKKVGNSTKITTAVGLIRYLAPILRQVSHPTLRVLVDAWYMKRTFILPLLQMGIHVIGQVRKDTVLYGFPESGSHTRGRPRKYGQKWTLQNFKEHLPRNVAHLRIYGNKPKTVTYYAKTLKARFLMGQAVLAIWSQLPGQKNWTLILSTDLALTPEQVIKLFAKRWKTEPMFNEIKHAFGVAQAWQQSGRTLHRWLSMIAMAYSLTRLVSLVMNARKGREIEHPIPWRKKAPVTAGIARLSIQLFFRRFSFSSLWNPKYKKLMLKNESFLYQRTNFRQ